MATEYNAYNGTFANKQQMENYEFAAACKPSCSFIHQVECASKENPEHIFYVRTGAAPTGADLRLYDLGTFQIATVGMQSNGNAIGELWVSYEIEFKKPRINIGSIDSTTGVFDHFLLPGNTTASRPFGSSAGSLQQPTTRSNLKGQLSPAAVATAVPALDGNGNPTGLLTTSTLDSYYFNPGISVGNYLITYSASYTTGGTFTSITPTFVNCAAFNLLQINSVGQIADISAVASANTVIIWTFFVTVTKANAKIQFTQVAGPTTFTFGDFYVAQIPDGIN